MSARRGRGRWSPVRRAAGVALLIAGTLLAALATLTPSYSASGGDPAPCLLICGRRGLADFLANVLLFLPLGLSLGLLRRRLVLIGGICALASLGIELAQIGLIAGRDATPSDLVSNLVGGLVGGIAGLSIPDALRVTAPVALRRSAVVAVAVLGLVVGTGSLLSPSLPSGPYSVSWTTGGPVYAAYSGRVQRMSIDGLTVVEGPRSFGDAERGALRAGEPLRLLLRVGPAQTGLSHIASLEQGEEDVIFLGARSHDLLLRYRSRAAALLLDQPAVQFPGVLAGRAAGATLEIFVWRSGGEFCLRVEAASRCPGFTAASGWILLQHVGHFSDWLRQRVDLLWMLLLCAPLGLWARRNTTSLAVVALVILGFFAISATLRLEMLEPSEALAGVVGFLLGLALQHVARSSSLGDGPEF